MQAHRGETVAPDPVLHDLKNLLTTVAALTVKVREEVVGSVSPQEAPHLHTALRDLGAAVGRTIALTRVSAPEEGSGGDLELSRYLEEHAPALGALLGQRDLQQCTLCVREGRSPWRRSRTGKWRTWSLARRRHIA